MFGNLNWTNVAILLLLALFIFGDKLPGIISEGLRMLRSLRRMAQTATTDLNRELGTDLRLEDLNPKSFVRKHLLSESEQEALLKPLKGVSEDVVRETRRLESDIRQVGKGAEEVVSEVKKQPGTARAAGTGRSEIAPAPAPEQAGSPAPAPRPSYDDIT